MADGKKLKPDDSAEKAYAAAAAEQRSAGDGASKASAGGDAPAVEGEASEATVAFPPKAKRGRKPAASVSGKAVTEAAPAKPEAIAPTAVPAEKSDASPSGLVVKRAAKEFPAPAAKATPLPKPVSVAPKVPPVAPDATSVAAEPAPLAVKPLPAPVATEKVAAPEGKAAADAVKTTVTSIKKTVPNFPTSPNFKEMAMDMSSTFNDSFKGMIAEAQEKAKEVFSKSNAALGEYSEFAKGNVEAMVESGKILASGLQDFGSTLAAEGRSAFETMTADLKELGSVKTPADFFRLQSDLVRRSLDSAVANGSKNTEALIKLASDAAAPISGRVSMAVDKVRQTTAQVPVA